MRAINHPKKVITMGFAFLLLSCGAETLAAIVFIPAFSAEWPVIGEDEYRIDLRNSDIDEQSSSGTLTGEERHDNDQDPRSGNLITGSYNGLDIEFTIQRDNGSIRYVGEMTPVSDENHQIIRIELNSSEGALVLGN